MNLVIGGCRGAYPTANNPSSTYGGDTTSFLIQGHSGDSILIDLGTGARPLNRRLLADPGSHKLLALMSHYHLDHLAGLPALTLLHDPKWSVTFAAPLLEGRRVDAVIPQLLSPPFSPLRMQDHAAHIDFLVLGETAFTWGALRIRCCALQHPGGSIAYRIEEGDSALVVATDVEWARSSPAQREALLRLCSHPHPADLLVMDGQYSQSTYPGHEGWGHSTWEECVALAQQAGVKRLVVTHHAPSDDDAVLNAKNATLQHQWPQACLARAGDVHPVPATPPRPAP